MGRNRMVWSGASQHEATELLREWVQEGDTIWTVVRWFSKRSGTRIIDLIVIKDNKPRFIGRMASAALQIPYDMDRDGLVTGGWGMDFAYDLVLRLSRQLFGNDYKLNKTGI